MTKLKFIYAQVNIYAINLHLIAFRRARRDMPYTHTHTHTKHWPKSKSNQIFTKTRRKKVSEDMPKMAYACSSRYINGGIKERQPNMANSTSLMATQSL